nr:unnamed protein product [Digitaria exilis]
MPLLLRGASFLRLYQYGAHLPPHLYPLSCGALATFGAVSKNNEIKKDEKSIVEKEDAAEVDLEIERVKSDPSQLQSMTVKELRELTRRMGVSGKGSKKDLVSAVMDSLGVEGNGKEGKSSAEMASPLEEPLKRKGGASVVVEQKLESSEVISETPSKKRIRTKQKSIKSTILEDNSVNNVKINKTSVQKETLVVQGAVPKAGLSPNNDSEPWTVLVHKKPQAGWIPYNPKNMRPPPLSKDTRALKILSWNVNGLKALLKSRGFSVQQLAEREDFDVLCLQETKMQARFESLWLNSLEKDVEVIKETLLDGYTNSFWTCSVSKLGYSGTAIISRVKPHSIKYGLGIPDHDSEGRVVTLEFDDFYLLTAYVPNSGDGLRRLTYRTTEWDPSLGNYMKVILTVPIKRLISMILLRGCLIPGIKHVAANMSRTASQRGYHARVSEPWTRLTHKERKPQWVAYNPRTMRPPPLSSDTNSMKILSWNVNGLQTVVEAGFSGDQLFGRENFDVLCLQETHLKEGHVEPFKNLIQDFDNSYWSCSVARLGYSGTAVFSRVKPVSIQYGIGISAHDQEGRVITLEFDSFYLVNAYIPNSGRGLRRLNYRVNDWDLCFSDFIKKLECSKPVIVAGDLNCARHSIDIHNPQAKTEAAGFTIEERESFEENFTSKGLIDTFRKQHPNAVAYTFWGENQRMTNKGWRLDYFLASESIADKVHDSYILPDVSFSDHSPIGLVLKL